jgi:uncharacterized protein (TIGR00255 family)
MTGYGKGEVLNPRRKVTVEIRAINSKTLDVYLRAPMSVKSQEIAIRNILSESLQRGKLDILVTVENNVPAQTHRLQLDVATLYLNELRAFAGQHQLKLDEMLPALLRIPDVIVPIAKEEDTTEWADVEAATRLAVAETDKFRTQEGGKLMEEFSNMVTTIAQRLDMVGMFEGDRLEAIKVRLRQNISEFLSNAEYDKNRMEQELFYFIEKLDITEEKTRLKAHCDYFIETLKDPGANGRKLGFIAQEMGREINTIGSKANHAGIQKFVVEMKDELEKIKEQLMNIQ